MSPPVPPPPLRATGFIKGRFGSPYDARSISEVSRAAAAKDWDDYFASNPGARPAEDVVMGAAALAGSRRGGPAAIFGRVLKHGPYQAIAFPEGTENETYSQDYWAEQAGRYYGPTTYDFNSDFGGYDASKDPATGVSEAEREALSFASVSSVGEWPAPITLSPTTTINPKRPRTVAAGFDGYRKVLTVVFRDGTYYNYYGVSNLEWGAFVSSRSKGKHIKSRLDGKVRGPADMASIPADYRELLYRVSRTAQAMAKGRR